MPPQCHNCSLKRESCCTLTLSTMSPILIPIEVVSQSLMHCFWLESVSRNQLSKMSSVAHWCAGDVYVRMGYFCATTISCLLDLDPVSSHASSSCFIYHHSIALILLHSKYCLILLHVLFFVHWICHVIIANWSHSARQGTQAITYINEWHISRAGFKLTTTWLLARLQMSIPVLLAFLDSMQNLPSDLQCYLINQN